MATVLVVDDEKNYLWMLEEVVRADGYDVVTCDKGADALFLLREATIDVLLTDLRMAEMDGMTKRGPPISSRSAGVCCNTN